MLAPSWRLSAALPLRIGVHRGSLFAGVVGSAYRRTFTVMGDTVNLAARVMARRCRAAFVPRTVVLDQSRAAFSTTPVAPFTAKGKNAPHHAVEVVNAPVFAGACAGVNS